jgi:thiosulfate dehydrogenase [quinone] large subunit
MSSRHPDPVSGATLLLRLALGMLFFFAAVNKFVGGYDNFTSYILSDFEDTWLPAFLLYPYAYALPFVELVLGAVLILGLATRWSFLIAGVLLISLAFGKVVQQEYGVVASNLNYVLIAAAGLWTSSKGDDYGLGGWMK